MLYEFEVPGKIVGKGRPRINTNTGITYTPTNTKDYETLIQQYFLIKYPRYIPIKNRVQVEIIAYMGIPKSTPKKDIEDMLNNTISPTKKPDIDNIVKVILDALNKFAYYDDNLVCKINVEKKYGKEEKICVRVEEY